MGYELAVRSAEILGVQLAKRPWTSASRSLRASASLPAMQVGVIGWGNGGQALHGRCDPFGQGGIDGFGFIQDQELFAQVGDLRVIASQAFTPAHGEGILFADLGDVGSQGPPQTLAGQGVRIGIGSGCPCCRPAP